MIHPSPTDTTSADFILDSYIMHIRTTTCTCGHTSKWSELNEVLVHRTRIGLSGLRRLVPARRLLPGYLVATRTLTPQQVPACHSCVDTLPSRSPGTSTSRIQDESAWALTLKRKYAPTPTQSTPSPTPTTKKHIPSASDL